MTQPNMTQAADLVSTRAVHSAMAASVTARGIPQSQALYVAARQLNETYFGGILTAILVEITAPGRPAPWRPTNRGRPKAWTV